MDGTIFKLPKPAQKGSLFFEETIFQRRSCRAYKKRALTLEEISQLLFSGQGIINNKTGRRTVPSAGALFPIEVYLVAGKIKGLPAGVYKYLPQKHQLMQTLGGDKRKKLTKATLFQFWITKAPATIVLCGVFWRTTIKYGKKAESFVFMEIGHAAQNISLQAVSLKLGAVCVGGFDKRKIKKILNLQRDETPLYLLPIGKAFKNYSKKEKETLQKFRQLLKIFAKTYEKRSCFQKQSENIPKLQK